MNIYHGCENTFIITEDLSLLKDKARAIFLCKKHKTDGLIVFLKDPYEMVLYNVDGSFATMCGNGIRAYAKYGLDYKHISEDKIIIKTLAGLIPLEIITKDPFFARVTMGKANYLASKMQIDVKSNEYFGEEIIFQDKRINLYAVWTGTEHLVVIVEDFNDIEDLAKFLSNMKVFKIGTNVNFMKIISPNKIFVRTFERGVGWTRACGTGSSASVSVGHRLALLENKVDVGLLGGNLSIEIKNDIIYMSGTAARL